MKTITCRNVGVRFERGGRRARAMAGLRRGLGLPPHPTRNARFWALRNVSFQLEEGSCLGVIGHNGSGKTTLLRVLCGVYVPDEGSVAVSGDVAPLLSLGAGISPTLSGKANVYLAGAVRSLSRSRIDECYERIRDYAELDEATMLTPMRYYSAGMRARLSFAVSAIITPDILLIDEVLSVGDAAFRAKSKLTLRELAMKARSVIISSHDMRFLREHCDQLLWLEQGQVVAFGDTSVLEEYARAGAPRPGDREAPPAAAAT